MNIKNMCNYMPEFIKKLTPEEAFTHGFGEGYDEKEREIEEQKAKTLSEFAITGDLNDNKK